MPKTYSKVKIFQFLDAKNMYCTQYCILTKIFLQNSKTFIKSYENPQKHVLYYLSL